MSACVQSSRSIAALAFGYFVVGTGAFVVAGLLNEIANDLGTSVAGAGQLMSAYSLALAIGAPLLTPLTTQFDRRTLITSGLVLAQQARLVAIAQNLASASAALNLSATYLGQMLGSVFGGGLISWFGTNALAWGGAVLLLAAGAATIAAGRVHARAR